MHAAYLCKRLKQRLPDLRVLVALWTTENSDRAQERLRQAGVDQVATTLPDAIARLRELQQYKSEPVPRHPKQGQSNISR
jgi:glycerophosphoryl diester phosphodiesterase